MFWLIVGGVVVGFIVLVVLDFVLGLVLDL